MKKTAHQIDREIDTFLRARGPWRGSEVQSLLFARPAWTASSARAWAKKEGYRYGSVDVTDDYVRLRQVNPTKGLAKRTHAFGKGIKAVLQQVK